MCTRERAREKKKQQTTNFLTVIRDLYCVFILSYHYHYHNAFYSRRLWIVSTSVSSSILWFYFAPIFLTFSSHLKLFIFLPIYIFSALYSWILCVSERARAPVCMPLCVYVCGRGMWSESVWLQCRNERAAQEKMLFSSFSLSLSARISLYLFCLL